MTKNRSEQRSEPLRRDPQRNAADLHPKGQTPDRPGFGRRFQLATLLLLCVCLAAFFGPTKFWIGQLILSRGLHPNLSADALQIHWGKSVVEARELRWEAVEQDRKFGLAARQAWFAVDPVGVVDRRLSLPKVILQDARLYVDDCNPRSESEVNIWQQHLDAKLAQLQWQQLQQRFESIAATQALTQVWNSRTERWVNRSRTVLDQAEVLGAEDQTHDNPLREEELLRTKLASIDEMVEEQELLLTQFENVQNVLEAETNRLARLRQQDQQQISMISLDGELLPNTLQQQSRLSVELAEDFARRAWRRFASYAEVADRLAQVTFSAPRPAYDLNVRANSRDNTLLNLSDVAVEGQFESNGRHAPFSATGNWMRTQDQQTLTECLSLDWHFLYQPPDASARVDLEHAASEESSAVHIRLAVQPTEYAETQRDERVAVDADRPPELEAELTSLHGELQGTLKLRIGSLQLLARDTPAGAFDWTEQSNEPIAIQVLGSWTAPAFTLAGNAPKWLLLNVRRQTEKVLDDATSKARARLDEEFNGELEQLRQTVQEVVRKGRTQTETDQQQLVAIRDRLQNQLDRLTGDAVARQNTYFIRK
jgi:hypothetical protein